MKNLPAARTSAPATASPSTPTSTDVARLAGVSRATVSYVLNDTADGRVGERTRLRVLAAAEELGYVPNAAARSLRAGRSGIVLLDNPNIVWGPLFSEFMASLRTDLRELGYTAVVYGDDAGCDPEAAVRQWAEMRPTAVMYGLGLNLSAQAVELLKRSGTQAVISWGAEQPPGAHWLRAEVSAPGVVAAEHLLERGRRRIGVIVPTDPTLKYFSGPRLEGVRSAVEAFARREKPSKADAPRVLALDLDYTEEAAAALAARLPESGLDAMFAYNDEYAMLVAAALHDSGIRVPGDIALVGADDLMLCRLMRPRLSSVRTVLPSGGQLAALIDELVNAADGPSRVVDFGAAEIVVRESS